MVFLWVKAIHIIAVICWMAGILYLYRLLVYHAEDGQQSADNHELLVKMEHRLYKFITVPSLMATWIAGISLVVLAPALAKGGWFHIKFLLVLILTVVTVKAKKIHIQFKEKSEEPISSKSLRIWNEVPTVLMIGIVILVVLKPFS